MGILNKVKEISGFKKFYEENKDKIKEVKYDENENKLAIKTEEVIDRLSMDVELQPNLRVEKKQLLEIGKVWCKWSESDTSENEAMGKMKEILGEELLDKAYLEEYEEKR